MAFINANGSCDQIIVWLRSSSCWGQNKGSEWKGHEWKSKRTSRFAGKTQNFITENNNYKKKKLKTFCCFES